MKKILQNRNRQRNHFRTGILLALLGSMAFGVMLWTTAGRTEAKPVMSQEQTAPKEDDTAQESYAGIVVLDPVGGGSDKGVTASGCEEKKIALAVAIQTAQLLENSNVKVYLTRTEDRELTQEARINFVDAVDADLYLEIGLSEDTEDESTYGIQAEYNDEYYLPDFGNVQWADRVTRQVTAASCNRAAGLFPATEGDILWQLQLPSARISLGYVTNSTERQLLEQENYQKKLAEGIAEAISGVYTNTQ